MIKKIRETLITINKSPLLLKTPSPSVHQKFSLNSPAGIPSDAIIFAPENLLIQARLALKFRDTRMDLAKIHRLSAVEKIHRRDRSCFRRPNELLSPLKQRGGGRGLPRIESDGISRPKPLLLPLLLPCFDVGISVSEVQATRNRTPNAVWDGRQDCSRTIEAGDWRVHPLRPFSAVRVDRWSLDPFFLFARSMIKKERERMYRWFKGDDDALGRGEE